MSPPPRGAPAALLALLAIVASAGAAAKPLPEGTVLTEQLLLKDAQLEQKHIEFIKHRPRCDEDCAKDARELVVQLRDECERRKTEPNYRSAFLDDFWRNEHTKTGTFERSELGAKREKVKGMEFAGANEAGERFTYRLRKSVTNTLFDYYGSDRGTPEYYWESLSERGSGHNYGKLYDSLWLDDTSKQGTGGSQHRNFGGRHRCDVERMVEIGIGSVNALSIANMASAMGGNAKFDEYQPGPGLKAWRDFFPNAVIYGLDVDPEAVAQVRRRKMGQI